MPVKKKSTKKSARKVTYRVEKQKENPLLEFKSTAVPYQMFDENKELEKLRVEQRNEEKDKILLEKELEKPSAARNKTLVNKYKARINESYSWPNIYTKKYDITAYAPDSSDIKIEERPYPYYATISFSEYGSDFNYKFPISKFQDVDGESFYQIDGTRTVIDSEGDISTTYSDSNVTPYVILKKFLSGDLSEAADYAFSDIETGQHLYYYFDFPGFRVTSKVKSKKETEKDEVKDGKKETKLQKFKIAAEATWVNAKNGSDVDDKIKTALTKKFNEGINMGGLPTINQDQCLIDEVILSVSPNSWIVYGDTNLDYGEPFLFAAYIQGLDYLRNYIQKLDPTITKSKMLTAAIAGDFIHEWNKSKLEKFIEESKKKKKK